MKESKDVRRLEEVVIRFSGDSGDGMQLTGTIFSDLSMATRLLHFPTIQPKSERPKVRLGVCRASKFTLVPIRCTLRVTLPMYSLQ